MLIATVQSTDSSPVTAAGSNGGCYIEHHPTM